jgi:hypothetical protein
MPGAVHTTSAPLNQLLNFVRREEKRSPQVISYGLHFVAAEKDVLEFHGKRTQTISLCPPTQTCAKHDKPLQCVLRVSLLVTYSNDSVLYFRISCFSNT